MRFFSRWIAASMLVASSGQAAIIISNVSNSALGGGNFRWTYTFAVQPDQIMREVCTGTCALANDFAILYDFPGYVPGTAVLANQFAGRTFALSTALTGTNPPFNSPPDSAALPNFSIALTGGGDVVPAGPGSVNVFDLVLDSTLGPDPSSPNVLAFGGQALNRATSLTAGNSGQILGPGRLDVPPGGDVPEPSTLFMLGGALCSMTLASRFRKT